MGDDAVCDLGEAIRGQGEDGWSRAGQADPQETGLCGRGHGLQDFGQTRDESLAVWLVHFVLHGEVDHVRVWWGATQGSGEEGSALEIEDLELGCVN